MDRLHIRIFRYNYETAGEIAYDTDRYMEVIEMNSTRTRRRDDYARGGRVQS